MLEKLLEITQSCGKENLENACYDHRILCLKREVHFALARYLEHDLALQRGAKLFFEWKSVAGSATFQFTRLEEQVKSMAEAKEGLQSKLNTVFPVVKNQIKNLREIKEKLEHRILVKKRKCKRYEEELMRSTREDIRSFRAMLEKKKYELEKLCKEVLELKDCEKMMIKKREDCEFEAAELQNQKLPVIDSQEIKEVQEENDKLQRELDRAKAILLDNIQRCLGSVGVPQIQSQIQFEHLDLLLNKCREELLKLREKTLKTILKRYYKNNIKIIQFATATNFRKVGLFVKAYIGLKAELKQRMSIKKKEQHFSKEKILQQQTLSEFKTVSSEKILQKRIESHSPNLSQADQEIKNSVEKLLKERAIMGLSLDEESHSVSDPQLLSSMRPSVTPCEFSQIYPVQPQVEPKTPDPVTSTPAISTCTAKMQKTQPNPLPDCNLQYIFPNTYKDRAPFLFSEANDGLPCSLRENSSDEDELQQKFKKRTTLHDHPDFVPLIFTGKNRKGKKGRRKKKTN